MIAGGARTQAGQAPKILGWGVERGQRSLRRQIVLIFFWSRNAYFGVSSGPSGQNGLTLATFATARLQCAAQAKLRATFWHPCLTF